MVPQVFATADIDAIAVWQPVANQALSAVAGLKIIFTSKTSQINLRYLDRESLPIWKPIKSNGKKVIQVWDKLSNTSMTRRLVKMLHRSCPSGLVSMRKPICSSLMVRIYLIWPPTRKSLPRVMASIRSMVPAIMNKFNVANGIYTTEMNVDGVIVPTLVQELQ